MVLQIVKILLPIVTALIIGVYARCQKLVDYDGMQKIKNILNDVVIPFVLFNSFLFAEYTKKSIIYITSILITMMCIYFLANFLKKFFLKGYQDFFPEHMSTWEGGSVGISLCSLLFGTYGLQHMALLDFGCALFLFGFVVPMLKIKDGGKANPSEILKIVFSTKSFDAAILGTILGATGVAPLISGSEVASAIYHGIVDIILSPCNFLILVMVGYSLNINKKLLLPVASTCITRLAFMFLGFLMAYLYIFTFIPFDKKMFAVLIVAFSLPPTYSLQIFTSFKGNKSLQEYSSTCTSIMTIICLIIFTLVLIYVNA